MVLVPDAFCLRFAADGDAPALAALRTASLIEMGLLGAAEAPAFRARARREIGAMLREERLIAWVLEAEGRIAGCACVVVWDRLPYPESSRHAEIAGVYVAPAYRRRGIARELVGEAIATARAHGVRRAFIAPTSQTRAFYRTFGFDESGWLRSPLLASGTESPA
jgi:N-acetylglutamate synthase-like GNAT family acetyltransferase